MIFGTGIDLAKTSRFEKWVKNPGMILRFFNPAEMTLREKRLLENLGEGAGAVASASEIASAVARALQEEELTKTRLSALCQHYASRFSAKEAFSKALGSGLVFDLRDVYVAHGKYGAPELRFENTALKAFKKMCPDFERARVFISISHEKEFAVTQVIIEI